MVFSLSREIILLGSCLAVRKSYHSRPAWFGIQMPVILLLRGYLACLDGPVRTSDIVCRLVTILLRISNPDLDYTLSFLSRSNGCTLMGGVV